MGLICLHFISFSAVQYVFWFVYIRKPSNSAPLRLVFQLSFGKMMTLAFAVDVPFVSLCESELSLSVKWGDWLKSFGNKGSQGNDSCFFFFFMKSSKSRWPGEHVGLTRQEERKVYAFYKTLQEDIGIQDGTKIRWSTEGIQELVSYRFIQHTSVYSMHVHTRFTLRQERTLFFFQSSLFRTGNILARDG